MKKISILALTAIIAASAFLESCKKGENDPFLSLRSRKARVAGEWKVTKGEGTSYDASSNQTTTFTFDGTTYTQTTGTLPAQTWTSVMEFTFEKDGTYKSKVANTVGPTTYTTEESGTWNFTGKVGEYKNKDHIVLRTLVRTNTTTGFPASTATYTGDDAPMDIMYIDQLKNKEIVFKMKGSTANTQGTDTNESTWTLTAK